MSPVRGALRGRAWRVGSVIALSFGIGACHSTPSGPVQRDAQVIEEVTFDPSLDIDLAQMVKLPEGVYIQDLEAGTGTAPLADGDRATLVYTFWLYDGTQIDSNSYAYTLGQDPVIDGFRIGMLGMLEGGTRRIIIPPDLGYGLYDYGPIPGGSILVYEVQLTAIG